MPRTGCDQVLDTLLARRPYPDRLLEPADRLRRLRDQMREVGVRTARLPLRARCTRSSLAMMAQPNSRVSDSSRLAAFTVVPMTANSSRFRPMSPSTTWP